MKKKHFVLDKNFLQMFLLAGLMGCLSLTSCKDEYPYDDTEPDWLGASVYDYLESNGNFKYYVQIIEDLNYKDVLAKTGSKTLFVTPDSIFDQFFKSNDWGIHSMEEMTEAQKKLIMNFSMVNNSYLIETLSNYYSNGTFYEGQALRRVSDASVLDSVPFDIGDKLPAGSYFDPYREKGIYLIKDHTKKPIVHILQKYMDNVGIKDEDFKIMTGKDRTQDDAYLFQHKVIEKDIVCKNGYLDVLDGVMTAPVNMAEYVRTQPETKEFASLLDRFCAPYYSASLTTQYNQLHPSAQIDSIFYIDYYAPLTQGGVASYPGGSKIPEDEMLPFDPGWNSYNTFGTALQNDMAVMFAPTNAALNYYFNEGAGRELKKRYGSWNNVPDDILVLLLTRHLRKSLQTSYPRVFYKMVDESSSDMNVSISDIVDSLNYVAVNGLVYVTNEIYPPDDYVSVYSPVLFSESTRVFDWAIKKYLYRLYLNSMVSSYAFLPIKDEALVYIDPVTYNTPVPSVLKFKYNPRTASVYASIHPYNKATGIIGDSVAVATTSTSAGASFIENRLIKLLDQSIIVGDIKKNDAYAQGYYITKDGNVLFVDNVADMTDVNIKSNITFQAGINIEGDHTISPADSGVFHQKNGTTFMLGELPQTPLQSVYAVLSDSAQYPEFNKFFKYCDEFSGNNAIFLNGKVGYYGLDLNVRFFNTYRYTVYVPDNDAMDAAVASGLLIPWDSINKIDVVSERNAVIAKMERNIRYHFQDNSVFIHPEQPLSPTLYYSATIKEDNKDSYFETYKNKFFRLQAQSDGTNITLTTEYISPDKQPYTAQTNVTKINPNGRNYCNIMTRDYVFGTNPKTVTSLTAATYLSTEVTTSSTAVIHLINRFLRFE